MKNRLLGKKDPENFLSDLVTIAQGQGASENGNFQVNPTQHKTDSSGCFGIFCKQEAIS